MDEKEIKELSTWKKLDKEWRLACSKSYYLIKSSVDAPIWSDMKTEFKKLHSEDKESTVKMWEYLNKTYGIKTQMSEELLLQKVKKLPNFESFKDTDMTLSTYQEICEERESWDEIGYSEDEKLFWLTMRLGHQNFSVVKYLIHSAHQSGHITFAMTKTRVLNCCKLMRQKEQYEKINNSSKSKEEMTNEEFWNANIASFVQGRVTDYIFFNNNRDLKINQKQCVIYVENLAIH